jgi:hypothetical protein
MSKENGVKKLMDRKTILALAVGILILAACGKAIPTIGASVTETTVPVVSSPTLAPAIPTETVVAPTETPEGVDYSPAFFDPQSEADYSKVIDSPSPIDNKTDYDKWEDGYLAVVNAKLENYTGNTFKVNQVGIAYDTSQLYFTTDGPIEAISSYKFAYQNDQGQTEWIVNKTYVFKDGSGNLVPITFTYPDSSDSSVNVEKLLVDPSKNMNMEVFYDDNFTYISWDTFEKKFFIAFPDNGKTMDSWRAVFYGKGNAGDRQVTSKIHLLITTVQKK